MFANVAATLSMRWRMQKLGIIGPLSDGGWCGITVPQLRARFEIIESSFKAYTALMCEKNLNNEKSASGCVQVFTDYHDLLVQLTDTLDAIKEGRATEVDAVRNKILNKQTGGIDIRAAALNMHAPKNLEKNPKLNVQSNVGSDDAESVASSVTRHSGGNARRKGARKRKSIELNNLEQDQEMNNAIKEIGENIGTLGENFGKGMASVGEALIVNAMSKEEKMELLNLEYEKKQELQKENYAHALQLARMQFDFKRDLHAMNQANNVNLLKAVAEIGKQLFANLKK